MLTTSIIIMGVRNLWGWLCAWYRYRKITRQPDAVFIDLPCITFEYYRIRITEEEFYERVMRDICEVVRELRPRKCVYIGKDGFDPPAKELLKWRRIEERPQTEEVGVDTGVTFKDEMFRAFLDSVRADPRVAARYPELQGIDIIYDPATSPGEAEVKFMNYLRSCREAMQWTWTIWSLDSDFFSLTLALRLSNVALRSPGTPQRPSRDYDITFIGQEISRLGDGTTQTVDDFIALTALMGNDFLPVLSPIERVVGAYRDMWKATARHLVNNGRIDKDVLKDILTKLGDEGPACSTKRELEMAQRYISGIYWYANVFFKGRVDWKYYYPFGEAPSIASVIACLDGFRVPVFREKKPTKLSRDYRYRQARGKMTVEQAKTVFEQVFGNSFVHILPNADDEPEKWNAEIKARVMFNKRAMDMIVTMLGPEIDLESADMVCTPGLFYKYEKGTTKGSQIVPRREGSIALPPADLLPKFQKGQHVIARADRQVYSGVVVDVGSDNRYTVSFRQYSAPDTRPSQKWVTLKEVLEKYQLEEHMVVMDLDPRIRRGTPTFPLFIRSYSQVNGDLLLARFGLSLVQDDEPMVSESGERLLREYLRVLRECPSHLYQWIKQSVPREEYPQISKGTPNTDFRCNFTPTGESRRTFDARDIWPQADYPVEEPVVGAMYLSISGRLNGVPGLVLATNCKDHTAVFVQSKALPFLTNFAGTLSQKNGIVLKWDQLMPLS